MLKAKTILQDKFWLIETNEGTKKGTITAHDSFVTVVIDGSPKSYDTLDKACWDLAINVENTTAIKEQLTSQAEESVLGYPTKCASFNPIWDIKRKIPVFTKTAKSKTLHAAGYYIVQFDTGWVPSFCPKVSTLDSNTYQGPYKDKLEMRAQLRKAVNDNDFD